MLAPPPGDVERIERALGWRPTRFRRAAESRGSSDTAARWIVGDATRSAFVKIGATDLTAGWTRDEHRNYLAIGGPFMPHVLGFDDDGVRPVLALEDLASAFWPPPWTDARVEAVLDTLSAVHTTPPPAHLEGQSIDWGSNWQAVADDPAAFLSVGLCSSAWLEAAFPVLIAASAEAPIAGTSLVHLDVRSDNVCFRDGRAVLIDWNAAAILNPDLEVAAWLPSLHAEGGPAPEEILPSVPELAAWLAGYFCSRAGEPGIADAPHVRPLQRMQASTALPWAARALGLPEPDRTAQPGLRASV